MVPERARGAGPGRGPSGLQQKMPRSASSPSQAVSAKDHRGSLECNVAPMDDGEMFPTDSTVHTVQNGRRQHRTLYEMPDGAMLVDVTPLRELLRGMLAQWTLTATETNERIWMATSILAYIPLRTAGTVRHTHTHLFQKTLGTFLQTLPRCSPDHELACPISTNRGR